MAAGARYVEDRCSFCSLPRSEQHSVYATFEGRDTLLDCFNGGVGQAAVYRAQVFQRETLTRMFCAIEQKGRGEVNGEVARTCVAIDRLAGVDRAGFKGPRIGTGIVIAAVSVVSHFLPFIVGASPPTGG